ncbi:MAG: hypothetical protein DDT32_02222 [Syntrophomonadaceae bacterium]|nr:hypothetical protein [Bacillota bacterium]
MTQDERNIKLKQYFQDLLDEGIQEVLDRADGKDAYDAQIVTLLQLSPVFVPEDQEILWSLALYRPDAIARAETLTKLRRG